MNRNKPVKSTNILILGLGGVGYYLAKRLVHEGYAITAIEPDSGMIRHADGNIDARLIQGNAMSSECWREADAGKMDYLIAVTNNDAVNMMSCLIGDRFGIPNKIARVRSTVLGGEDSILNAEDLKVDLIIHPEELAAQEIFRLIKLRAGNDIIDVSNGQIQAIATRIHEESPLAYRKLKDISMDYDEFPFRVVAVTRGITTLIPSGEDELLPQDQAFFMAGNENLPRLMSMAGVEQQKRHRVMIVGGGLVGSRLAELLGKTVEVRLIEKNELSAKELSFALKNAEVLHGDGSDSDVLISAGLLEMDTFISATGENETNIMSCVLAKHLMTSQSKHLRASQSKHLMTSQSKHLMNSQNRHLMASQSRHQTVSQNRHLTVSQNKHLTVSQNSHLMTSQGQQAMNLQKIRTRSKQKKCIALVNKEDYVVLAVTMGSDIALNKKILAGNEILKFIRRGELLSVVHLHGFDAEMVEIVAAPGSPITRKPLSRMDAYYYGKIMIGGIHRNGVWQVAVGDSQIQSDERVIVVCLSQHLKDVQQLFLA